jgi:hypothetical protein
MQDSRKLCNYYKFAGGGGRNSFGGYQDQGPPEEVGNFYI